MEVRGPLCYTLSVSKRNYLAGASLTTPSTDFHSQGLELPEGGGRPLEVGRGALALC